MQIIKKLTLTAFVVGALAATSVVAEDVTSLRGDVDLAADSTEFERRDELYSSGGFKRTWKLQPPVIPHKTDNDRVTMQENTCLNCHSKENAKKEDAPVIGDSHFVDAAGVVHEDMNMRRYFCSQCHVPQMDLDPLVENDFEGDN